MSSIDSYHPISGLKHKLLSYQKFLEKYPNYRNKIIFIQFVGSIVQAFDSAEDHKR
jgi:trehalose-6-phosphate synthase